MLWFMLVKYQHCHKYLESSIRQMFEMSSNIEVSERLPLLGTLFIQVINDR